MSGSAAWLCCAARQLAAVQRLQSALADLFAAQAGGNSPAFPVSLRSSPGYYSPAGATDCSICPVNQFSPVYGLANRTAGDQKCIYCATGYVAVTDADEVGKEGSTGCMPW